jgi:hypothetical protein
MLGQDDDRLRYYAQQLEDLLKCAGNDPSELLSQANSLLEDEKTEGVLRDVLRDVSRGGVYAHKRQQYLESMLSGWRKALKEHIPRKETWVSQIEIYRASTYISCWNRLDSMSLAMWELYSKGQEGVAIRSTKRKLEDLFECNSTLLEEYALEGEVVAAQYFDKLETPSKETENRVEGILIKGLGVPAALFSIKPNIFEYEHEVRAILYPKRDPFQPITNPYPDRLGFELPVGKRDAKSEPDISRFVDAVHIHPTLGQRSMMFQVVSELHRRFGVEKIDIIAEPNLPFLE